MKKKKHNIAKKSATPRAETKIRDKSPLAPLSDRVIVQPLSPEESGISTPSGIIIPDTAKEKPEQGTVIAVGPGKWNESGTERIPLGIAIGDRVLFSKYGYDEVKVAGTTYYVIGESNILAVIS